VGPVLFAILVTVCQCGGSTTPGASDASATDGSGGAGGGGGGGGGSGVCNPACSAGRTCCGGQCVNTYDDPSNCGSCGLVCGGATSYCEGTCKAPPCRDAGACSQGTTCCGSSCCASGQLCCASDGPVAGEPTCFTPTAQQPTCPPGCAPLCVSDRNLKRDVLPVDGREVLETLARVPMSTWSYEADDPSVRHLGPMAQDFHDAFGLGASDRSYDPIDAHGVAFASIQALYEIVREQDARIERLEAENAKLRARTGR
jgi:Chaperone of endosialidase/Stigma-specific protein, Stig1